MKKSLSIVLAMSMVFGSFSAMASAAELTAQQKYDALEAKGIFAGKGNEGAALNDNMTRAEFARVAALLLGLDVATKPAASKFTDVALSHWAVEEIHAVEAMNVMEGNGNGTFTASANVTTEQVARVLVDALKLEVATDAPAIEGVSAWAYGYVKAAIDNGLVPADANFQAPAKRSLLVTAAYAVEAALDVPAVYAVAKAAQTGAKKITVDYNRALTAAEQTASKFDLKNGLVNYPVTAKFAEDGKSVVLTATFLPAAEYALTVDTAAAVTVKVEEEKVVKLEIGAATLQQADNQDLDVKALNQFTEEVANAISDSNISVFSSVYGSKTVTAGKVNLASPVLEAVDTTIVVTVAHPNTGLSASKTYKVVSASSATVITLGTVAPLKDKTRVSVNETGFVLPYTLADQYGAKITLPAHTAGTGVSTDGKKVTIGGIDFVVSDTNVIDPASFSVDADGVLKFNTKPAVAVLGGYNGGTAIITALNVKSGASAYTVVKAESVAALKTFQVSNPGVIVVEDEKVIIPAIAADSFGAPIEKKDVPSAAALTTFKVTANGTELTPTWKANGDLQLVFPTAGSTALIFWVNGAIASQLTLDVKAAAYPVSISGTKDLKTTFTAGGEQDLNLGKLVIQDNYGRPMTDLTGTGYALTFVEAGTAQVTYAAGKVTASATEGTEKITAKLNKAGATEVKHDISFNVINKDKVTAVTVGTVGTVYGHATAQATHSVDISLSGKTAEGTEVAIAAGQYYDLVTSSDTSVVAVDSGLTIFGKAKGTAVVAVWKDGTKLAEQTVTASDVAPAPSTVKFTDAEATTSTTFEASGKLEVKDQYGKVVANAATAGKWFSSKAATATVDADGTVSKVAGQLGIVTITYVSTNGLSASILLNVE